MGNLTMTRETGMTVETKVCSEKGESDKTRRDGDKIVAIMKTFGERDPLLNKAKREPVASRNSFIMLETDDDANVEDSSDEAQCDYSDDEDTDEIGDDHKRHRLNKRRRRRRREQF